MSGAQQLARELLGLPAHAPDSGDDNTPPPAVTGKES